jgi:uncharacterized protein YbcI
MTDPRLERKPTGLPAEISDALVSLWTQYAGKEPARARTEIRGNVVTCVLVDAVADFNRALTAPAQDTIIGNGALSAAEYKSEAVAAVVRATRQRVRSFISSHDTDTDVATEVFTLEPALGKGRPRGPLGIGA